MSNPQNGTQEALSPRARLTGDKLVFGIDVGSTTVKVIAVDPETKEILWSEYHRHETRQAEKTMELLIKVCDEFQDIKRENIRCFVTGSGSGPIAEPVGGKFVQEVNAVTMAVDTLHPDVMSVIELGGQDAKIIIWLTDPKTGVKRKVPSMNDKCAGGTGAVIDKINAKLRLSGEELQALEYFDVKLHPVAGKCGV